MPAALRLADAPRPGSDRVGDAAFILSLRARGIFDVRVLRAMETVPRDLFAPRRYGDLARSDVALPLPCGQTMSAPATVAIMLAALDVRPGCDVLEIGTGSGYVAAILARMGARVQSRECRPILAESAAQRLAAAGFSSAVLLRCRDGLAEAPDEGHHDRILVHGALAALPASLTSRLRVGGRLVSAVALEGVTRVLTLTRGDDGQLVRTVGVTVRIPALLGEGSERRREPSQTEL